MPMYPAPMTALAPTTVPTRWQPVRITAAVLCFVALVLVVASVFLPLYSGEVSIGGFDSSDRTIELTFTPWDVEITPDVPGAESINVPHVGYPLVFAAVFLAAATCACWYAATPSAARTATRAAGVLTATSGAFLIGTAWTTATLAANGVDYFITLGTVGQGLESDASYRVGYWLMLTAVLLAFTAAVLSLLPTRQPAWGAAPPANPYMATPPYGFAVPQQAQPGQAVVYALPPEQPAGAPPLAVDPLTGQPFHPATVDPLTGQPVAPSQPFPAPAIDPMTGQPVAHNPTSQPFPAPFVDPVTGQPLAQGPVSQPFPAPAVDPVTGQPLAQGPASQPFQAPAVDPVTGQPNAVAQHPAGTVDPLTGQPVPAPHTNQTTPPTTEHLGPVDPLTGQPLAPGLLGPPTGVPAPTAAPVPFTPEPVGQVNGTHPAPAVQPPAATNPPPIVLPQAPPPPEKPGPAIPSSEDPLAEPPRT